MKPKIIPHKHPIVLAFLCIVVGAIIIHFMAVKKTPAQIVNNSTTEFQ